MNEGNPLHNILVYIDGSESSIVAAQMAIAMAKTFGSKLKIVYVVNENLLNELLKAKVFVQMEKMDYERDLEEDGKRYLNYVEKLADAARVKVRFEMLKGVAHRVIADAARQHSADLIVMGTAKEQVGQRSLLSKERQMILGEVDCAVLLVPSQ